jgi:hypothetical protein
VTVWLKLLKKATPDDVSIDFLEDVISFFKNKRETKATSPSERHMGQYIAMAQATNGTLRRIVVLLAKRSVQSANPYPDGGRAFSRY